jgi:hypothetical protein
MVKVAIARTHRFTVSSPRNIAHRLVAGRTVVLPQGHRVRGRRRPYRVRRAGFGSSIIVVPVLARCFPLHTPLMIGLFGGVFSVMFGALHAVAVRRAEADCRPPRDQRRVARHALLRAE